MKLTEDVKIISKLSLDYLKPKRTLPDLVFTAYIEANGKYPQAGEGIFVEVLYAFMHLENFDYSKINRYGLTRTQYKKIEKKMFSLHDAIGIEKSLKKIIFMKFFLRLIGTFLLNTGIIRGISNFLKDHPDKGIIYLKILSEKMKTILDSEEIQKLAKERWQTIKKIKERHDNESDSWVFRSMLSDRIYQILNEEERQILRKYFTDPDGDPII